MPKPLNRALNNFSSFKDVIPFLYISTNKTKNDRKQFINFYISNNLKRIKEEIKTYDRIKKAEFPEHDKVLVKQVLEFMKNELKGLNSLQKQLRELKNA